MTKINSKSQNGRSMVEMLGVLAIVGVLSVGGVYGYGVAMKKHKANELLHQASMLATTISAQIQSKGEFPQSIEDFGNGKYGTFNPPSEANAEQFTMQITGMDEAVCAQVAKMSGGMVRKAECDDTTLTLTYNNNLSSDKVAADYNDDTTGENCTGAGYKWCSELSTPACKQDCCSGITLNTCQESCDSSTGEITPKEDDTDCTTADGNEGTCNAGVCEEATADYTGVECTDYQNNTECGGVGSGWYCKFNNETGCTDSGRGTGECTEITSSETSNNYSSGPMTWWSAYSFCKGLNSTMVTGRAGSSVQCGTLSDYGSCSEEPTSKPYYYWLDTCRDNENTACSSTSCNAFTVDHGDVDGGSGRGDWNYALCE